MKYFLEIAAIISVIGLAHDTQGRVVNLVVIQPATEGRVVVASNEVAEIVAPQSTIIHNAGGTVLGRIDVEIGVSAFQLHPKIGENIIVAGPATIRLTRNTPEPVLIPIRIEPESFPPDKTLVIPERTGATVRFQCSTNLLDWADVWSGSYTNVPSNKFFRICADRIP